MLLTTELATFALSALLLSGLSAAAPSSNLSPLHPRDDSGASTNSTTSNATSTSLEPVVPPAVDPDDLSTLALDTTVTLAWAGSTTNSGSQRKLRRDDGIFSQANFTFAYPTVPLDHSTYVSGISCSSGSLIATLSNAAYNYAKKQWKGVSHIVFVTATDGCGMDNANDFFLATSISFTDSEATFTAQGASASYRNVTQHFNLQWGDIGNYNLKRSIDKREMFEPHSLHSRAEESFTVEWSAYLGDLIGTDEDAPWEDAALLYKWGKEDGEEDDSYEKGEVASATGHHKRGNESALAERDVDYGLALYCVECGFGGSATIWGEIDAGVTVLPPFIEVDTVQAGFDATFKAGLYLGMEAFVKYEKEWSKELDRIGLGGFDIPAFVDIGPYVSVSVEAKAGIEATGTLLIGAAVEWDNIDIMIDLLDSSNSHANGLVPAFTHKAEASGELKVEASLGLPIKLGIGINIFDNLWEADAAIVDTPSVVLEGVFDVSADVTDDGTIEYDVNGGCYGIAWDIHFENTLQAVIEGDDIGSLDWDLIEPQESDPIAEGCIGYVNDGTTSSTTSSTSTTTSTTSTTTKTTSTTTSTTKSTTTAKTSATCTPSQVIVNPKVPSGLTCKRVVAQGSVLPKFNLGKATTTGNFGACAAKCLKSNSCVSFSYNNKKSCQLYNKAIKSLRVATKKCQPTLTFYDKKCYTYKTCSK